MASSMEEVSQGGYVGVGVCPTKGATHLWLISEGVKEKYLLFVGTPQGRGPMEFKGGIIKGGIYL
jgi:hypothetical protein